MPHHIVILASPTAAAPIVCTVYGACVGSLGMGDSQLSLTRVVFNYSTALFLVKYRHLRIRIQTMYTM